MNTPGYLKKWLVDNKLDRDGMPDPKLVITIEIQFQERFAVDLASMTTGNSVQVALERIQMEMADNG